jgi:hypothetical protein
MIQELILYKGRYFYCLTKIYIFEAMILKEVAKFKK